MATTSTVVEFRCALVDRITNRLVDVQVEYAEPNIQTKRRECVYLGATTPVDQEQASLKEGRRHRRENYITALRIQVSSRAVAAECERRAIEILAAIENLLADDPMFRGQSPSDVDGLLWAKPDTVQVQSFYGTEGVPETLIELTIESRSDLR